MTAKPIVIFDQVTKSYDGQTHVVKPLDLVLNEGEFLTLLGPSGSGKTTILMMLAGFEEPTGGRITMQGRSLNNLPAHKRGIGVVFQNYALFPHMSVAENLAFPLEMKGIGRAERDDLIRHSLDLVHLAGLADRKPSQLSGGQQQRVALARALIFKPKLVLMDEPLGALDKHLREQMQTEIRGLHQKLGMTFVYVTHDQGEALTMADRIAVLKDGRLQQIGTPQQIYREPANVFVASFIGESNQLEGVVEKAEDALCHVRLDLGGLIMARASKPLASGTPVVVCIRPEQVSIGSDGADSGGIRSGSCDNRLEALVEERIFSGDHTRLRLSLAGAISFMMRVASGAAAQIPAVGERVSIGFDAQDAAVLAKESTEILQRRV